MKYVFAKQLGLFFSSCALARASLFLTNLLLLISALVPTLATYAADGVYQLPAPELLALVDAPRGPEFRLGPLNKTGLLLSLPKLPSIAEVAQPELKLAGLRIHPSMRAASRNGFSDGLSLLDIETGKIRKVKGLPSPCKIADFAWSPDEEWLAFSIWIDKGVELWLLEVKTASAHRLINEKLNAVTGAGFSWLSDSEQLLVRLLPKHQGPAPRESRVPKGPLTLESKGGKLSQNRTYTDLLKDSHDADMLEWQLQTQLATVTLDGEVHRLGSTGPIYKVQTSPDGLWLLTTQVRRPYSYQVPIDRFAQVLEMWTVEGKKHKLIADLPLRERQPNLNEAVPTGPRNFAWRNDQAATLFWLEAQGAEGEQNIKIHDVMWQQAAPFGVPNSSASGPQKLMELAWRFNSVVWGSDQLALVTESWGRTRETHTWRISPGVPNSKADLLFSRKTEDQYANPGTPVLTQNDFGRLVIRRADDGASIFMTGLGASAEGDRPFLDRVNLNTHKITRLWRSKPPYYEEVLGIVDDQGQQIITSRESLDERPNLYLRDLRNATAIRALTNFPHPTPQFKGIKRSQIHYEREDGVALSATLYLPPGYDPKRDGPRPMLMWAYPKEFKTTEAAGQITGSPYKFNRINIQGPQVMLARGYTVLDGLAMPIVGEGRKEPNDTYTEQIKMNAEAAVDEVVRLGVADRQRIAIGGHSYGASLVAHLLAHTNLFRAGIARSGAYNRTLTPFGFQAEERVYWKAKDAYLDMSPFHFADQIEEPLLLIHGEDDNNPGTFPMQSERLYQALQGLGSPARLVMLPNESHIYRARESMLHLLWEQDQWLNKYVKNAKSLEAR